MGLLAMPASASSQAQQFGNLGTSNYNWGVPYGSNYNYGYMRYGQGGFGASPYDWTTPSQPNPAIRAAPYGVYGPVSGDVYQVPNPYNVQAAAQAMQTQREMQAMEPRYDVRKRTRRTVQAKARQANKPLTRDQVLSADGKVLWPSKAPSEGDLGKSRAAAEAAILVAYKEFKASGKASVQDVVEAKERLYAYGHPALDKAAGQSRQAAEGLLHFLSSLERVLDSLGGV
jgi:hypothetical protein